MSGITRKKLAVTCAVMFSGMGSTVSADWNSFWSHQHVAYQRNNAWPQPFSDDSARQATAPFDVMKHNGWRLHNTLGNEFFREGDGALLASGHKRINWIASQAPAHCRVVYVLRGNSPAETDARLASVRETLNRNAYGTAPQVMVTDVEPTTASGAWATQISRDWLEALPKPKLPDTSSTGSAGATSGD
jgi:hypothetical protein